MNKSELVEAIAKKSKVTKADTERVLNGFLETVTVSLKKGNTVSLVGFGSFSVKQRAKRKGRNPQTGAPLTIKAAKVPAFKPGKTLRESVNKRR